MQRCSGLAQVALPAGIGQWREQGLLRGSTSPSSAHSQQQQPVAPSHLLSSPSPTGSSSPVGTGNNTALRAAACDRVPVILDSLSTSIKKPSFLFCWQRSSVNSTLGDLSPSNYGGRDTTATITPLPEALLRCWTLPASARDTGGPRLSG